MKIKIFFLESEKGLNSGQKNLITKLVKKHASIAGQNLKLPLMNFTVYPNKEWCIEQTGEGGYTASPDWIQLFVDPTSTRVNEIIKSSLLSTVYHEMHHAKRMGSVGYGQNLLQAVISEGLAIAYAEKMFPSFIAPWGKYSNNEIKKLLKIFIKNIPKTMNGYNHEEWFLGFGKPHWLGYKVGIHIIRELEIKDPSFNCIEAVNIKAEEIFKKWQKISLI
jgi:uncharacterized protein YjaZ